MKAQPLETERLLLKPLCSADASQMQKKFPRWEIVRYLAAAFPWPYPDDFASHYVDNVALPTINNEMAWFWTIRRKKDPSVMIGLIYLNNKQDDNRGFWLVPELQGQGYMTEACDIVTDFWFNTLNKKVLRVFKATVNEASKKMSINMSMRRVDVVKKHLIEGKLDCDIWEITKQEWNQLAKNNYDVNLLAQV